MESGEGALPKSENGCCVCEEEDEKMVVLVESLKFINAAGSGSSRQSPSVHNRSSMSANSPCCVSLSVLSKLRIRNVRSLSPSFENVSKNDCSAEPNAAEGEGFGVTF